VIIYPTMISTLDYKRIDFLCCWIQICMPILWAQPKYVTLQHYRTEQISSFHPDACVKSYYEKATCLVCHTYIWKG
jgi:hypothetical protein